jgi:DNA polymerase III subunit beta
MKFKILKSEFLEALNNTQGVVEKKNVMPILANILIEAEAKSPIIKISATDLEVAVHVFAQAQVEQAGQITVSAKSLFDIVRESASEEIIVSKGENERIDIQCNQSQYKILGMSAKEFPSLPQVDGEVTRVASEDFSYLLGKVTFAMSTDETRYHLNGVLLEKAGKESVLVATDGHRLSYCKSALDLSKVKQEKIIIPRKGVNELKKIISNEKSFDLCVSERHLFVKTEKQCLYIRLIDGNFPDYGRVIPDNVGTSVDIPRDALVGALKRVSLLASDRSKGVSLYFCNNVLTVNSSNPELGEAKEEVELDYKGAVLNIGFNAKYFLDVLGVIDDDNVTLSFKDELSPCLITAKSVPGFKSVIMPMRM